MSSGDDRAEHWGITLVRTLYAPAKDFRRPNVSGLLQDARVAIRCGEAWRVPESQIYKDHGRFGVDNSFGRGELEVAIRG